MLIAVWQRVDGPDRRVATKLIEQKMNAKRVKKNKKGNKMESPINRILVTACCHCRSARLELRSAAFRATLASGQLVRRPVGYPAARFCSLKSFRPTLRLFAHGQQIISRHSMFSHKFIVRQIASLLVLLSSSRRRPADGRLASNPLQLWHGICRPSECHPTGLDHWSN